MPEKALQIGDKARATFAQNQMKAVDMGQVKQMSKIPSKSVFNYAEMNPRTEDAVNPNSAVLSYFQLGEFTYEQSAVLQVLITLLNEPLFDQLRSKESLGYVVQSQFSSQNKVLGGQIIVQSSTHGPEFLESRINSFLGELAQKKELFTAEQVQKIKDTQQTSLSMQA
jgi:secreted Zn-dependent insulinase-like peptidase